MTIPRNSWPLLIQGPTAPRATATCRFSASTPPPMENSTPFRPPLQALILRILSPSQPRIKAVSQLLWPDKDREEWFSLGENHERASRFGLHPLRNRISPEPSIPGI